MKVRHYGIFKKKAYVFKSDISGFIPLSGFVFKKLLTGPFCYHDHSMSSLIQALFKVGKEAIRSFKIEIYLRYKNEIYILLGQCGGRCDESRVPSHQLNKTNSIGVCG